MRYIIMAAVVLLFATTARAEDPAIHGNHGHGWYENAELTPAAKIRFGISKCCADALHLERQSSLLFHSRGGYLMQPLALPRPITDYEHCSLCGGKLHDRRTITRDEHGNPKRFCAEGCFALWENNATTTFIRRAS